MQQPHPNRRMSDYMEKTERDLLVEAVSKLEQLVERIDKINDAVFGNGKTGLQDRVLTLELQLKWVIGSLGIVGGLLASAIFALLWGMLTGQIQINYVP